MNQYDILLIGRTPASAVLARLLAGAGRSVALIDDGMIPNSTGTIRWLTLRDLGCADQPDVDKWPAIQLFRNRLLLEDGVLDTAFRSDRLGDLAHRVLVARSVELADVILAGQGEIDIGAATPSRFIRERGRVTGVRFADGSEIGSRLTIVTSGNHQLLGASDRTLPNEISPPFLELIEITWAAPASDCERVAMTGGPLAEVNGSATLLLEPDRTSLALMVSAHDLVQEAITVSDLLGSVLDHPALSDLPALATASSASVRLLTLPDNVELDRYGSGYAVFGAMQGLSDAASFDREVNLAQAIGSELCAAPVERYGSVALQCAMAAIVRTSDWAHRGPHRDADRADWPQADSDRFGGAAARTARLSMPS